MTPRRGFLSLVGLLLLSSSAAAPQRFELPPLPAPERYGDVVISRSSEEGGERPVGFSHWTHRMRHTCRVCHFELGFEMTANATPITEEANRSGEYCGACHNGEIAFGHTEEHCAKCHSGSTRAWRRRFKELRHLPEARYGNEIDWSRAVELGMIQPEQSLFEDDFEPISFSRRLKLEAGWTMIPPAYFPHEQHRVWNDCATCHPDIFNVKKKTTEHFEMRFILDGKFCGVCHLKVAFPLNDCKRCHPDMRE